MQDLIVGGAAIAAGISGLIALRIAYRKMPAHNARMRQLYRMSAVELHSELTRCAGAIMTCGSNGDFNGMLHAHRAMIPIMRALAAK